MLSIFFISKESISAQKLLQEAQVQIIHKSDIDHVDHDQNKIKACEMKYKT